MKAKVKRVWALLAAICVMAGLMPIQQAKAVEASNATMETAIQVTAGQTVTVAGGFETSEYWYYIDTTKAGQIILIETSEEIRPAVFNADGERVEYQWSNTESGQRTVKAAAEECGRYYIRVSEPCSFTVDLMDGAANISMATAIEIQCGDTITPSGEVAGTGYWYFIQTTQPGQFIQVKTDDENSRPFFYDATDNRLVCYRNWSETVTSFIAVTEEPGRYYIQLQSASTFTVLLLDNDKNEPNQTPDTAAVLTPGQSVDIIAGCVDVDCFSIQTTQPGQDVALTISGFSYAVQGSILVSVDDGQTIEVSTNKTLYFHAAEEGKHYITITPWLRQEPIPMTISVAILEGDGNEPNDTAETATTLRIGTDCTFSAGGYGDEDWFTFEAAPDTESGKLYTLNFMDLNTDYSDQFYYDVYAPDGTAVSTGTMVTVRHAYILSCEQQGLYKVRVYTAVPDRFGDMVEYVNITRSALRIRVEEGGADPYENNNTWLTAAQVGTDQPVQFILSDTADLDWFCFEVPEPDMTLTIKLDSAMGIALYHGEDLQKAGNLAQALCGDESYSSDTAYYKFTEPGLYYLKLYAQQSNVTADLRTMTLSLECPMDTENNDTWKQAASIYEGVPKAFDLTAYNDIDWFKLEVPAGIHRLMVKVNGSYYRYIALYRGVDFETAGDNAAPIKSNYGDQLTLEDPATGTYYVRLGERRPSLSSTHKMDLSICYALWSAEADGITMETAVSLAPGIWQECMEEKWFSLGELAAGSEIRTYRTGNMGDLQLKDASGVSLQNYYRSGIYSYTISEAGTYYFYSESSPSLDENGEKACNRFRYELGTDPDVTEAAIEGPDTVILLVGETVQLSDYLSLNPADAIVTGSSDLLRLSVLDNPAGAISDDTWDCTLTGERIGTATVRVYSANSGNVKVADKTIQVTVVDGTEITGVSISGSPTELPLGSKAALTATMTPNSPAAAITWTSSDSNILYVSSKGVVTAVGSGTASITATAPSGVSDTVTITVTGSEETIPINSVCLDKYAATIYMGEEPLQLTASVLPENAEYSGVIWTSSNTGAATVEQNGSVTPVSPGVTVVSAAAGGYKASCVVTVQAARIRVESITFSEEEIEIPLLGKGTTLTTLITPADATVKTVTWVSADESVAVVSRTGIVTPISVGETTITVTTLDGGKTASILVRVIASPQLGDINMDGYVDSADAMMALQAAVGKIVLTEAQVAVADINKDGYVDAADAVRILRFDAGLIDSLNG